MPRAQKKTLRPAPPLRLIALELTRRCTLRCRHCRAVAMAETPEGELTRREWVKVLEGVASFARPARQGDAVASPVVILTGGEPMLREDIYDIAARVTGLGLPVAVGTCGALLDEQAARRLAASGVRTVSVSLDGATAASHDAFRGRGGAFEAALAGIAAAKQAGLTVQVNTTVSRVNIAELPAILELAVSLQAGTFNPFLLVPTGRGSDLAEQELSAAEYEVALTWLAGQQGRTDIAIRVTCAPHYQRILAQRFPAARPHELRGCMAGHGYAFVSHRGKVQPCGFLQVDCGDLRTEGYDLQRIWTTSPVFAALRDRRRYGGKCGACEYHDICGGCRARAYAASGDYLAPEPLCLHVPAPRGATKETSQPALDSLDEQLIWVAQAKFPISPQPFKLLGELAGIGGKDALQRLASLRGSGVIRRIGAVFDSGALGYVSTLVAARVPVERLVEVAELVSGRSGVTHNYSRRHEYNLWFTLTAASRRELETTLEELRARSGIGQLHSMPAEAVYKLHAVFRPLGLAGGSENIQPPRQIGAGEVVELDQMQRELARLAGGDLPLVERPFDELAARAGWRADRAIEQLRRWLEERVIRRFGAIVNHRRLGYAANGMAVFDAPVARIDELGRRLSQMPCVSHCYRRRPLEGFSYNLFAMVHGPSEQQVRRTVDEFAASAGLASYDVLMTDQEFKKLSPSYFT